jgi:hypothetical protein
MISIRRSLGTTIQYSVTPIPRELQRAIPVFSVWRENFDDEIGCAPDAIVDDPEAFGRNEEEIRASCPMASSPATNQGKRRATREDGILNERNTLLK